MTLRRLLALAAIAAFAFSPARAQQRDYTGLFGKFHALGLPDVTGATYIRLTMHSGGHYNPMGNLHDLRLSGNAWLIEENKEGESRVIADNCSVIEVWDSKLLNKLRQARIKKLTEQSKDDPAAAMRISFAYQNDGKKGGQWQKADLGADVKKAVAYMEKQKTVPRNQSWAFNSGGYANLFIFAIHISKHGYKDEANKIIQMLFDHAADRRKVILQVINALGDAAYGKAYAAFRETSDWQAFDKAVSDIMKRFAVGWRTAPAVKRLATAVKKRIAQPTPPPVTGEGLTDEDLTLARELTTTTNRYMQNVMFRAAGGNLWVLSPSEIPEDTDPKSIHVLDRIKARGVKSIPLLLALLRDEYLTEMDLMESRGYGRGGHFRASHSFGTQQMNEQMINRIYNQMARPASRADIAAQLLQTVPLQDPRGRRRMDLNDREELYQECKAWYAEHGKKTPAQLARLYMQNGGHSQRNAGMQVLIQIGSEEDMAAIEKRFLESQRPSSDTWQVQQYVRARGVKAKAFVDKYEAALKQRMTSTDDQLFKHDNMKQQVEKNLETLRALVDAEPAKKMIEELLAGKRTFTESQQALQQRLASEKPDNILTMMLEAAIKAEDPDMAGSFIQWSNQARYMRGAGMRAQFGFVSAMGLPQNQNKLDPAKHAELWKKLLADDRRVEQQGHYAYNRNATVADMAAGTIETLYKDRTAARMYSGQSHYQLGHRLRDLVRKRALARLAGKTETDLPEFPSADNLTPEQTTNMVTKLMAVPDTGIAAAVDALSLDEMLVLMAKAAVNTNLNTKLAPKAMIVKDITETPKTNSHLEPCREMKGKRLTKAMVRKIVEICRDLAGRGKTLTCNIARLPCLDGVNIALTEIDRESEDYQNVLRYSGYGGGRGARKGTLTVTVGAVGVNAHAIWPLPSSAAETVPAEQKDADDLVIDEIVAELDEEVGKSLAQTHEAFWGKLDKYLAGAGNVCQAGTITILGLPVLKDEGEKK